MRIAESTEENPDTAYVSIPHGSIYHRRGKSNRPQANNRSSGGLPEAITKVCRFNDEVTLLHSLVEQSERTNLLKGDGRRRSSLRTGSVRDGAAEGFAKGSVSHGGSEAILDGTGRRRRRSSTRTGSVRAERLPSGGTNPRWARASHRTSDMMGNNMGMPQMSQMSSMKISDMNQALQINPMNPLDHLNVMMAQRNKMNQMFGVRMARMQQQPINIMEQQMMDMMQMQQPLMGLGTGMGVGMRGMGNCWR